MIEVHFLSRLTLHFSTCPGFSFLGNSRSGVYFVLEIANTVNYFIASETHFTNPCKIKHIVLKNVFHNYVSIWLMGFFLPLVIRQHYSAFSFLRISWKSLSKHVSPWKIPLLYSHPCSWKSFNFCLVKTNTIKHFKWLPLDTHSYTWRDMSPPSVYSSASLVLSNKNFNMSIVFSWILWAILAL